jgi:hypothetical protein
MRCATNRVPLPLLRGAQHVYTRGCLNVRVTTLASPARRQPTATAARSLYDAITERDMLLFQRRAAEETVADESPSSSPPPADKEKHEPIA